jgi:hypothetical protein
MEEFFMQSSEDKRSEELLGSQLVSKEIFILSGMDRNAKRIFRKYF